jgi:hypothetical protein
MSYPDSMADFRYWSLGAPMHIQSMGPPSRCGYSRVALQSVYTPCCRVVTCLSNPKGWTAQLTPLTYNGLVSGHGSRPT